MYTLRTQSIHSWQDTKKHLQVPGSACSKQTEVRTFRNTITDYNQCASFHSLVRLINLLLGFVSCPTRVSLGRLCLQLWLRWPLFWKIFQRGRMMETNHWAGQRTAVLNCYYPGVQIHTVCSLISCTQICYLVPLLSYFYWWVS